MTELIVHCGMPKTGSTAIQRFLFDNQEALLSQGILFPVSGRYKKSSVNHHALFYALCPDRTKIRTHFPEPEYSFDVYCQNLEREISESQAQKVVLSSEMVFDPIFDIKCLEYFKNNLNYSLMRLVIVLRHQEEHIESGYAQAVTGPQKFSGTPVQYLERMRNISIYDYYSRLMDFERVFGKENLQVNWYHDIRNDAVKMISYELRVDEVKLVKFNNKVNVKRSWLYVKMLCCTNKYFRKNGKYRTISIRLARVIDGAITVFGLRRVADQLCAPYSERQKNSIKSEYESTNNLVNERYILKQ